MRIKLLKDVQVPDHPGVKAGDVFDIAYERGEILVRIGHAELIEVPTPAPAVETRDPIVESRDPEILQKPPRKSVGRTPPK